MKIGGLLKLSLIDYPEKVGAVIFTQGCNFRCSYCHNPELVKPELFTPPIPEEEILPFLEKRKGMLEGVCVTGGEPLQQPDLATFLVKLKKMGYAVKLDTNGTNPAFLAQIVAAGLVDYIAMDVKGPEELYERIVGARVDLDAIGRSIKLIMTLPVAYEFRTTLALPLRDADHIAKTARMIAGAKRYVLQQFKPQKTLDQKMRLSIPMRPEALEDMRREALKFVAAVDIR